MIHSQGHWKSEKLVWLCKQQGWTVTASQVQEVVKRCPVCQKFEKPQAKELLQSICCAKYPGEAISMDLVGPLPQGRGSGKYIASVIDHLSRWGGG